MRKKPTKQANAPAVTVQRVVRLQYLPDWPKDAEITTQCQHKKQPDYGYVEAWENARIRQNRGEKQTKCKHCGVFVWSEFWTPNNQAHRSADKKGTE